MDFAPEVEQNRAAFRHDARLFFVAHDRRRRLSEDRLEQKLRVLNARLRDGDDSFRIEILADALVVNGVRRQVVGESFRQSERFLRLDRLRRNSGSTERADR